MNTIWMVKIVDFGLAKTSNLRSCLQTEEGGTAKGTLRYIAPGILLEKEPFAKGSNVWSVGSTSLELYTGASIWSQVKGMFASTIMKQLFEKKEQPSLKNVPRFLKVALKMSFDYNANNRITTVELIDVFQNVKRD